jgi:hypothetical protein
MSKLSGLSRLIALLQSGAGKFASLVRNYPRSVAEANSLEQRSVLIALPVFVITLLVVGSVGAGFAVERERTAHLAALAEASQVSPSAPGEFALQPAASSEVFHSLDRYSANLEELRTAIEAIVLETDEQKIRAEEMLSFLVVREWQEISASDEEVCFQYGDDLNCVEADFLEEVRIMGGEYVAQKPTGIGICFDWFGDVCIGGDVYDSEAEFRSWILDLESFVLTGEWSPYTGPDGENENSDGQTIEEIRFTPGNLESLLADRCWLGSPTWAQCSGEELVRVAKEIDKVSRAVNPPSDCYVMLNDACVPEDQVVPPNWREAEAQCRAETGIGCHGDPNREEPAEPVWTTPGTPPPVEYAPAPIPQECVPSVAVQC